MNAGNGFAAGAACVLAVWFALAATAAAGEPSPWFEETSPAEAGMHPAPLNRLVERLEGNPRENIHSVIVVKGDSLVLEAYFPGTDMDGDESLGAVEFGRETLHDLRGATKSVVSMLLGAAIQKRMVKGTDARLVDHFPDREIPGLAEKRPIRLRDALSMSAGLEWNEAISYSDPANSENLMIGSPDPIAFVLERPLAAQPGTVFNYNGGLTELIAALVGKAAGADIGQFAAEHLFAPLDITEYEWRRHANGQPRAASGLRMRPYDLAKIAHLLLERGMLSNRQLVSKRFIDDSFQAWAAAKSGVGDRASTGFNYGFHWWLPRLLARHGQLRAVMAWGNGGQVAAVLPHLELVVVMTAGNYDNPDPEVYLLPLRLITGYVLPSAGLKDVEVIWDEP